MGIGFDVGDSGGLSTSTDETSIGCSEGGADSGGGDDGGGGTGPGEDGMVVVICLGGAREGGDDTDTEGGNGLAADAYTRDSRRLEVASP